MKVLDIYKKYGIYFIFLLVFLIFSLLAKNFLSIDNLLNILRQVSMIGIVVVGITFVMIGGGADLSVGGQMAVGGIITAILMVKFGVAILPACLVCLLVCTFLGFLNGFITVKLNMFSLVVTLGMMLILQGLAYVITGGYSVFGFPEAFKFLGQGYIWVIPVPVIIFIVVVAIAWFILENTYLGRQVYAMGSNPEAARLAGINLDKMTMLVFTLCGLVTGISSLIMLSRINSGQPSAGASYPFDCMTAAVLGGISFGGGEGKLLGAVMGVLIIGVLNNGMILMGVDAYWQGVIKGIVLIAAVGIDTIQRRTKKVKITAV
jgi:ribose transport system permease protein